MIKLLVVCVVIGSSLTIVSAETIWSDYSLSYLKGHNYQVGDTHKQVVTFEYVTGLSWGDSFMFFDRLESNNGDNETYGEWSPRIKVMAFNNELIKDLLFSTTIELGSFSGANGFTNSFTNYLVGIGRNINIPRFNFFKVNFYHRNAELTDNNYQTTISWAIPLDPLSYDGFIDYVTASDDTSASMNLTSQLVRV